MPQVSIYLDQATLDRVKASAKEQHKSVSRWVGDCVKESFKDSYPPGFWDLLGSVPDDGPDDIEEIPWEYDIPREPID
jgi:hypothetical protein